MAIQSVSLIFSSREYIYGRSLPVLSTFEDHWGREVGDVKLPGSTIHTEPIMGQC